MRQDYIIYPPPHPTSHRPPSYTISHNQPSFIQMPPKNIHFPNYQYPPQHHSSRPQHRTTHPQNTIMQAPRYETPLHQVPWNHAPLIPLPTLHIKCLRTKGLLCHINNQHIRTQFQSHHLIAYSQKPIQG